jgi:hypothetical protein
MSDLKGSRVLSLELIEKQELINLRRELNKINKKESHMNLSGSDDFSDVRQF